MSTARVTQMPTAQSGATQELSTAYVREIFKNLESGDGKGFFDHVLDNVDWIVEGTHPLAGHYHSKAEFLAHTFEKLEKVLPHGAELRTEHVLVSGDWAVVELHSLAKACRKTLGSSPGLTRAGDLAGWRFSQFCPAAHGATP